MIDNLRKSERTRNRLKESLVKLCIEKGYNNVTVGDICTQAETYRSTFYRYYDTKDDMLREIEHEYIEETRKLTPSFADLHMDMTEAEVAGLRSELTADLVFHREHRELCMFLLSPYGDPYFTRKIAESLSEIAERSLRSHSTSYSSDTSYVVNFFVNGYIATIYEWLRKQNSSPEEIAELLLDMMFRLRK